MTSWNATVTVYADQSTFSDGDTLTHTALNSRLTSIRDLFSAIRVEGIATERHHPGASAPDDTSDGVIWYDNSNTVHKARISSAWDTIGTLGATQTWSAVNTFSNTTDATSSTAAGAIFSGGVAIAKKLYVGSTTDATSSTAGGTVLSGGLAVAKKLYVGTDAHVLGDLYLGSDPLTLAGAGAHTLTLTTTADSTPTFPSGAGTLAYLAGTNTWSGAQTFSDTGVFSGGALVVGADALAGSAYFYLNATAAHSRGVEAQSAGKSRWFFGANSEAESTGDAGSNYILVAYDDNANYLFNVMKATRSNGNVDFPQQASENGYQIYGNLGLNYANSTGTSGADNTAQTLKSVTIPGGTLAAVGQGLRVTVEWVASTVSSITATFKFGGTTILSLNSTSVSGNLTTLTIFYAAATTVSVAAQLIYNAGTVSLDDSSNFTVGSMASNQDFLVTQSATASTHITVKRLLVERI